MKISSFHKVAKFVSAGLFTGFLIVSVVFAQGPVSEKGLFSASWSDIPGGEIVNPAGAPLIAPGTTFFSYNENDNLFRFSLYSGFLGTFGWQENLGSSSGFTYWTGTSPVSGIYDKGWNYGLLIRPVSEFSFGFSALDFTNSDNLTYVLSTGLRPGNLLPSLSDRLTLTADISFLDSNRDILNYSAGISVEPVDGVQIDYRMENSTADDAEMSHHLGLTFCAPHTGVSYHTGSGTDDFDYYTLWGTVKTQRSLLPMGLPGIGVIEIHGSMPDKREKSFFFQHDTHDFWYLKEQLDEAVERKDVKGVLLNVGTISCGTGKVQEIVSLLRDFRSRTDKPVVAFMKAGGHMEYLVSSIADRIVLAPGGGIYIPGFIMEPMFFKGTLDKLGIEADLVRVGDYKSAVEPFTRKSFSEGVKEEYQGMLDDLFGQFVDSVVANRKSVSEQEFRSLVDGALYTPAEAVEKKLVDEVGYEEDAEKLLAELCKIRTGKNMEVRKVALCKTGKVTTQWSDPKSVIAVVEARGNITESKSGSISILFNSEGIDSDTYVPLLRKLRDDKSVKGIVLRVDSGGGSGLASDLIWNEIRELEKRGKPVIASVENVAGSGGYYILCGSDEIIANPSAIVGSIGVMGGKIVTKGFYDKIGVTKDRIKTGENSEINSSNSKFTEKQRELIYKNMLSFYKDFVTKVANGRDMKYEEVDKLGSGRVYTARDGVELGLVDRNGGLLEAIDLCKERAGIKGDYSIKFVPGVNKLLPIPSNDDRQALAMLMGLSEILFGIE